MVWEEGNGRTSLGVLDRWAHTTIILLAVFLMQFFHEIGTLMNVKITLGKSRQMALKSVIY